MSYVCSPDINFLWAVDTQNKSKEEGDGESTLVWNCLNAVLSVFKALIKGLEGFREDIKPQKLLFVGALL